jgi:hypothetical protein
VCVTKSWKYKAEFYQTFQSKQIKQGKCKECRKCVKIKSQPLLSKPLYFVNIKMGFSAFRRPRGCYRKASSGKRFLSRWHNQLFRYHFSVLLRFHVREDDMQGLLPQELSACGSQGA